MTTEYIKFRQHMLSLVLADPEAIVEITPEWKMTFRDFSRFRDVLLSQSAHRAEYELKHDRLGADFDDLKYFRQVLLTTVAIEKGKVRG